MNSKSETQTQRRFRYSFDDLGYYLGLCYPIDESALQTPIYQPNSTDQEPFWKDGYIPRYDFQFKNWTLEKRGQKEVRQTLEDELTEKIVNKLVDQISRTQYVLETKINDRSKMISDEIYESNKITDKKDRFLQSLIIEQGSMVQDQISLLHKNLLQIAILLEPKPTIYQKLKSWFSKFLSRR